MARRLATLAKRLETIRNLAQDLALDLRRSGSYQSLAAHAIADSIKAEIEAVIRLLNLPER